MEKLFQEIGNITNNLFGLNQEPTQFDISRQDMIGQDLPKIINEKIIEIIPGLFISNNYQGSVSGNLILVNSFYETDKLVLKIVVDPNILYINNYSISSDPTKTIIDYDNVCNFILNSYKQNENTIIYSDNLIIPLAICIAFINKYLNLNILDSIYYVINKTGINIKMIPNKIIFDLFYNLKK